MRCYWPVWDPQKFYPFFMQVVFYLKFAAGYRETSADVGEQVRETDDVLHGDVLHGMIPRVRVKRTFGRGESRVSMILVSECNAEQVGHFVPS